MSATTCHCRAALPLSQLRALDGSDKEADQAREKLAAVQAELASALAKADEHGTRWRKAADELRATEVRARHLWALRRRLASARAAPMLGVRIRIHHLFVCRPLRRSKPLRPKRRRKTKCRRRRTACMSSNSRRRSSSASWPTQRSADAAQSVRVRMCACARARGRACAFGTRARLVCARIMCACGWLSAPQASVLRRWTGAHGRKR